MANYNRQFWKLTFFIYYRIYYSLLGNLKGETMLTSMLTRSSVKEAVRYTKWANAAGLPKDAVRYKAAHLMSGNPASLPVDIGYYLMKKVQNFLRHIKLK